LNLNTFLNDKFLSKILNSYFNLDNSNNIYSLKRIFVGISDFKHSLNKIIINVYIFNKQKYFYIKRINNLNKFINKPYKTLFEKSLNKINNKSMIYKGTFNYIHLYRGLKYNIDINLYISFLYK
jgi:hypothetical protein